ncbi:MAG: S1 family peptidase [Fibrobacterota bacterium]|nr:serine protease [Chitinispirillaceae bacterium]
MVKNLICIIITLYGFASAVNNNTADVIFQKSQNCVYQIRVIDISTGKKSSIGSGFAVTENGFLATNYHVVAEYIDEPKRFRLECIGPDGAINDLKLIDLDIVHDLAIVLLTKDSIPFLSFKTSVPSKGTRIYAMGNPMDLGMTIIEGTYNGLIEQSLYEKILFSGSLNPGMSGGPSLDTYGNVIGINVSTTGNEISFLVPVKYLQKLLDSITIRKPGSTIDFTNRIEQELFDNQEHYMSLLLNTAWKSDTLGKCLIPREIDNIFKSWGETSADSEMLYTASYVYSVSNDDIYVSPRLTTGSIGIDYSWYESTKLSPSRFFQLLESHYENASIPNYNAEKELMPPRTHTRFVTISGQTWKTTTCIWKYKKFTRLHDVVMTLALVSQAGSCMMIEMKLLGVSRDKSLAFCNKFMGAIAWVE